MSDTDLPEEIRIDDDRSLKKLSRAITNSQGNFALILVRCNYTLLTEQIVKRLREICAVEIRELHLPVAVKTLYTTIRAELGEDQPQSLLVFGLEAVNEVEHLLTSTNQVREEFRKHLQFPLVLWVSDTLLQKMTQCAPDFKSWAATSIKFEIETEILLDGMHQTINSVFSAVLEVGAGKFLDSASIKLTTGALRLTELEPAINDLIKCGIQPEACLAANWYFLIGREADTKGNKQVALEKYEQSLEIWRGLIKTHLDNVAPENLAYYGCLLFHLGLWWRQYAVRYRVEYASACQRAKEYYQQCLEAFQKSTLPALESKFINALGEVLTRLEDWDSLPVVAERAVSLHQSQHDLIRLAYGYGLLAEVALHYERWTETRDYAKLALQTNEQPFESTVDWSWDRQHYRNYYRLLLAQAQQHLSQQPEAIVNLETARTESHPEYDPPLYIRILESLRTLKFSQGDYWEAFQIKQERLSIEQQYGLRAFVGAGRLQARRRVTGLGLASAEQQPFDINQEIAASGRLNDVHRLVERISRADHKLTVIYGQSGVGKSSLVQAGLLPALKQLAIEARDVLPVLLQVYSDWAKNLGLRYTQSLEEVRSLTLPGLAGSMEHFTNELYDNANKNLLTVLIFDQFEEFFFAYKDITQRRPFFEFLRDCFNIPYVKIILSLREDYLHYLLECNRLTDLEAIDNNILDKKILYYLGNFLPADARSVIEALTKDSQLYLEPSLIDALVQDLAGELGEIRPIELQVVGAQLQTEKITTLAQYQAHGPKEALVGRFLDDVVQDCGTYNENFARIILYLLTDENNTRPLKTRTELEADLALEPERLELILKILVKSGLAFQIPGFPTERYQLVHDYLVPFIRQQQSATLVADLEKEREQRKLTEAKLNQALTQQLKTARRAWITLATLLVAMGGVAIAATITGINLYISNLISESSKNTALDRLVSALQAGTTLKRFPVAIPGLRLSTVVELNAAIANLDELNRLEGHTAGVTKVIFSPDGQLIASVSEDNTAKVWSLNGQLRANIERSQGQIISVTFSPNSRLIATVTKNKKIQIWTVDGKPIRTLTALKTVSSASFSPNQKLLAAGVGNQVVIWNLADGSQIKAFKEHEGAITSVGFSPDGKMIAAADQADTVKLWSLEGKDLRKIENYGTVGIRFSSDSKTLILASRNQSVKTYALDGTLIKNFEPIGSTETIKVASLHPDGKLLAAVRQYAPTQIQLNDVDSGYIPPFEGHKDRVMDLSFSPDGKILASASQDKTIRLWNMAARPSWLNRNEDGVQAMQVSSDSSTIAAARFDSKIQLLDREGNVRKSLTADGSVLRFSPDNQTLLTGSAKAVIKLYNAGKQPITLAGHLDGITDANISPNGETIVSVGFEGDLRFWRSDGQLLKTQSNQRIKPRFNHSEEQGANLEFSPDSQRIAVMTKGNLVRLWTNRGTLIATLKRPFSEVRSIRFSPDSQRLVTTGNDNLIYLYTREGREIAVLEGHRNRISDVEFSPNSEIIASVSSNASERSTIKLWNKAGQLIATLEEQKVSGIRFSPDNATLAVLSKDNTIQLWTVAGQQMATLPHNGEVTDAHFSPDGELLASASKDNTVRLWRKDGAPIKTLRKHRDPVSQVIFSPTGQTLLSMSEDGMVQLWQQDGIPLKTLQPASNEENLRRRFRDSQIQFSSDGRVIALIDRVSSQDESNSTINTIKLWHSDGQALKTFQGQRDWGTIAFSAGHKTVAVVERDPSLKLWGMDGSALATFLGHQARINDVGFSSNSKVIASASDDKTVRLWSRTGKLLKQLDHADKVNSVRFSPDGKVIASASDDKTVKLWNPAGQFLKKLDHTGKVNSVRFSPDGKVMASASDDKTVKLWNPEGTLLRKPLEHSQEVKEIRFSPDGKALVAVTRGSVAKLWQIRDGKELFKPIEGGDYWLIKTDFSPDSSVLTTFDPTYWPGSLEFSILKGLWFKKSTLQVSNRLTNFQFSPDGKMLITSGYTGVSILDLDLDKLLIKGCDQTRNYLLVKKTKLKGKESHFCDGI